MMSSSIFNFSSLLLLISVLRVSCLQTEIFYKIRQRVHEHQYSLHARHDVIEEHSIVQPLDHFEAANKQGTFRQRYWVNANYWRKAKGPVFLYIGGEFEMSGTFIDFGHIVELAEEYGGLIFGVEHRYYGLSTFEKGLENENLRFLSSQQALADLAEFCVFAQKKYHLSDENKWIAYGGSYPGSLAAWFRLKYPHLVSGAVASSAPVQARTDFQGYQNVVASSFASLLVGGSVQRYRTWINVSCINNNFTSYLEILSNTTQDPKGTAMLRQWTYQTCTQFGYYQTCESNSSCIFSTKMPDLVRELYICSDVFNIPPQEVYQKVAFTNAYYGGNRPKGSRIIFVNGSIDPWHALSVLVNQTSAEVAIFIPGTSHCANMDSNSPSDPSALRQARQEVALLIGEWLYDR